MNLGGTTGINSRPIAGREFYYFLGSETDD
ncbi:hypothetical protein DESME_00610 [Desulfitobacterium metallireducens DSM 15288]|uniref:Uncharacterized protein n=1 Tax=Desulfitobacterium metallireducens DSM 15288 TaxID=871968 RepID=W0EC76_9FIRM|nr:hypothetical protein DESME_00610 [Desulfitobacterium metallireducens DSM 15288]